MRKLFFVLLSLFISFLVIAADRHPRPVYSEIEKISWDNSLELPALDGRRHIGLAGAFSGFIGDNLIVAGGANFPDATPWNGGHKTWWNSLYHLNIKDTASGWILIKDVLPAALAYGATIELPDGLLCIGGCDSVRCYKEVFLIQLKKGKVTISDNWPSLPVPLANTTGALLNNKIYIAGGQESMTQQDATSHFFVLDLSDREKGWQKLASWPGEPRGYAVSVIQSDGSDPCFYLFSGRDYNSDGYIKVLTDGYAYNPRLNYWKKLSLEFPVMAGTALSAGANYILFMGGVSALIPGSDNHPGFDNKIRLYHTKTNTLVEKERVPYPIPVTTTLARKGTVFYFASGEIKPGIRTPHLLKGEIIPVKKDRDVLNHFFQ